MKTYHLLVCLIILLLLWENTFPQNAKEIGRHMDNIVLLPGYKGLYGFITGTDGAGKRPYFIVVKNNKNFEDKLSILYNGSGNDKTATLVKGQLKIGDFYLGLYMINGAHTIQKKYYQSTTRNGGDNQYYTFLDGGIVREKGEGLLDLALNINAPYTRLFDNHNYLKKQINFLKGKKGQNVFAGMPVIDPNGNVSGIIASNGNNEVNNFYVLDIVAVREMLLELGHDDGNDCKYFNLVEYGSHDDETVCEKKRREVKEEKKRLAINEARRIEELKQQDKKLIDETVRTQGKRALHPVQRRIYNSNIDRWIAVSATGSAAWDFIKTQGLEANSFHYSYGANIHINPDKGTLRFTLKPRYTVQNIKPQKGYAYGGASGFNLKQMDISSFEVPVMLEFALSRKVFDNDYFGIGYCIGRRHKATFDFDSKEGLLRQQNMVGDDHYSQQLIFEMGTETGRVRYNLFLAYQVEPYYDKKYEVILGGEVVTPFRDLPKNYFSLGVELSFRLWNRWKNDYRTIF